MPIIYTLISRPPSSPLLIDCTNPSHTGNFQEISQKILQNIPEAQLAQEKGKVTFVFEGHTFNFLRSRSILFMCMCDVPYGRTRPFLFLKDVADTYFLMFSGEETVLEGSTERSFKGVLAQKMKNYSMEEKESAPSLSDTLAASSSSSSSSTDPALSKMKLVQSELDTLATSAKANIDKVISRGEAIESLVDRTHSLRSSSESFKRVSKKLHSKLWRENMKLYLLMAAVVLFGLYLITAVYCGVSLKECL